MTELTTSLRSFEQAVGYLPNQVFIGNAPPELLWATPRPAWMHPVEGRATGTSGEILSQDAFYQLMAEMDQFELIRPKEEPREEAGELALYEAGEIVATFRPEHETDEALSSAVLLENLTCKASAVHAARFLLRGPQGDPERIGYVIACGEEAVGDRYQRGGGNLAKAIAEACVLSNAGGSDVKAFCAGPIHALVMAAALVAAGVHEHVLVVAGGSLPKLGMKFLGALDKGVPVLEDVLAGMAVLVGPDGGSSPVLRLDAVGTHRVRSGSSQQQLLEDIVARPLDTLGVTLPEIDRYATELHNPEITEPAGAGDVPSRNYRMLAALGVLRGELGSLDTEAFVRERGLPGFAPTQGHIASAIPWLPHALTRFGRSELRRTMLLAKGSLFLGRMTRLWDGASITLEA